MSWSGTKSFCHDRLQSAFVTGMQLVWAGGAWTHLRAGERISARSGPGGLLIDAFELSVCSHAQAAAAFVVVVSHYAVEEASVNVWHVVGRG